MSGMSAEPPGCVFSSCNTACPAGTNATYSVKCSGGATGMQSRCCPGDSYPDVLLLVDRGTGQPTTYLSGNVANGDYSPLTSEWTSARELLALPGERLYATRRCSATLAHQRQQQQQRSVQSNTALASSHSAACKVHVSMLEPKPKGFAVRWRSRPVT